MNAAQVPTEAEADPLAGAFGGVETEEEAERRRAIERDEALAQQATAAAVAADIVPAASPVLDAELGAGRQTEWALRLLCAWTVGRPTEADGGR